MPEAEHAEDRDDPWSVLITAVRATLDDCELALSDTPGYEAGEALEFTQFLRAELPRLLEDWQTRRRGATSDAAVDQPPDDRPIEVALPATLHGHDTAIKDIAFSPNGTTLASGGADYYGILVWHIRTGRRRHVLRGHTGTVSSVAFHPDGTHLASGSFDTTIRLWPINAQTNPPQPTTRRRRLFGRRHHRENL